MNLENIVKKLFLGGTLAVAAAVSLVTVGSYAVDIDCTGKAANLCKVGETAEQGVSAQTTFTLKVEKVLTLTGVKVTGNDTENPNSATISATVGELAEGTLSATVQSNSNYTISLSAANPALTMTGADAGAKSIAAGNATTANTWGIKKAGADAYTALTAGGDTFFTSAASAPNGVTTQFGIGVLVDATLPSGEYSTEVTVTAAAAS